MIFAAAMLLALALDVAIGWSGRLLGRVGHPVIWLGRLISWLEARLNRGAGRVARGGLTVLMVVAAAVLPALLVCAVAPAGLAGVIVAGVLAWPLVAARSMHEHVAAVARPLVQADLAGARRAVSLIVGRDPEQLDEAGVARAALESLAENTSDGVIAPLFWGVLLGLPGIFAYKAVNTLDSMIGHRSERYEKFGKVAARVDDLVNLVPARLTGLLFALVSGRFLTVWRMMWREAGRHRSPNAGWPEAAMAGALDVRLSGPRRYAGGVAEEPWINGAARDPEAGDIGRGLAVYARAIWLAAALLALLAVL